MPRPLTVVVTGGGSGGHIMPILAVAAALKDIHPDTRIVYIGQKGDRLADVPANNAAIDEVFAVRAGKFRRYHGMGLRQTFDPMTALLNVRDMTYIGAGLLQSLRLMRRLKPDVIFTRGGYVSVPVALAGALCRVPFITHDSDSTPSLANRIIARWARLHAVALPADLYPYPQSKTMMVGVPIAQEYLPVTPAVLAASRRAINVPVNGKVVLVTGGGNGAHRLNQIMLQSAGALLKRYPYLTIVHIAGRALAMDLAEQYNGAVPIAARQRVVVKDFVPDLYNYSAAADVIIARGGATNLAEFAAQAKACLIIPSPQLIWNVRNADVLAQREAIRQLSEDQAEQEGRVTALVSKLLDDQTLRNGLAERLHALARPGAAHDLAEILIEIGTGEGIPRATP